MDIDQTLKKVTEIFDEFVVVGSYALYLQKILPTFSYKDLDIVINVPKNYFTNEVDIKYIPKSRFSEYGWVYKPYDLWIEVLNKPLPEYDIIESNGIELKVKSKRAIKEHYTNLDVDTIGGHLNFINKIKSRKELIKNLNC